MSSVINPPIQSKRGEPVWELAKVFPYQGQWTEQAYLKLDLGRHVEFDRGTLEFPPMPNLQHQQTLIFLLSLLNAWVQPRQLGKVMIAPFPLYTIEGRYREPDLLFLEQRRLAAQARDHWNFANLVIEIVSEGREARERDFEKKREEYAQAGFPEYWIVDPEQEAVHVLRLADTVYDTGQIARRGETARSLVLPGLEVDVAALFDAGRA